MAALVLSLVFQASVMVFAAAQNEARLEWKAAVDGSFHEHMKWNPTRQPCAGDTTILVSPPLMPHNVSLVFLLIW